MRKLKTLFFAVLFSFCLILSAANNEEKDRILDNFFAAIKDMQTKNIPPIESMEADIISEITFSRETAAALQPFISDIFRSRLPSILRSDGFLRIKFKNTAGENKAEHMFLYSNSSIGSFAMAKSGKDIELHIPKLGVIINDDINEIRKIIQQQVSIPETPASFPANFFTYISAYIAENEETIREKIVMEEKNASLNGIKTHLFTYPADNGTFDIAIYDNFWTFAAIGFTGGKNTYMQLKYPKPDGKADNFNYLPDVINIKGERDNNLLSVELSKLKYNRLFSESDFRIERLNFREFVTIMYLKFLQAR
ncbi:MAG: hypothetical protein JW957_04700 [Candidatus Omnitrophica bacterium]|nr:hypothetical protein [Candidatus Omnitrophota bacterium]